MVGRVDPPSRRSERVVEGVSHEMAVEVTWLIGEGSLRSERIRTATSRVSRNGSTPATHRGCASLELPRPIPGREATISAPPRSPLFDAAPGLEVSTREVVGLRGKGVTVENDEGPPPSRRNTSRNAVTGTPRSSVGAAHWAACQQLRTIRSASRLAITTHDAKGVRAARFHEGHEPCRR